MVEQNNDLEIYKQRYDTFRHLDRLRWQMFQIAVITASLVMGIKGEPLANLHGVIWVGMGTLFVFLGFAKLKISEEIMRNYFALKDSGRKIKDTYIPDGTKSGITSAITAALLVTGYIFIRIGLSKIFETLTL